MSANKVRVPVRGSVGKSVRFSADSGASGATIGVDFRLPDGSIPTLQQLAAALVTGDALSDQPGNIIPPGGGPAVIWQNIQYVPRNVLYPARPVQAEEEAGEEYYRMAVPGPAGVRGLQGFSGPLAEEPEDHISIPGAAGVAGSAGPPGAISAVHLWPDDPEDHISIPGVAGPQGASGNPGTQGPISTVHLYPDDPEDPMTVPGAAGPTGTSGAQGAPGIISAVHLWPDDPEDPMTVPGAPGTAGAAGAQGAPGIISAVHLWPDDPEDHISIPGAAGLQGTAGATGAQGPPGLVSAVHLWPDDPEDPLSGVAISFAPPATLVGLTAIPGGAPNAMRSDAAPALSQAIVPIWTGAHTFNNSFRATAATAASIAVSGIDIDVQAANAPRIRWTSSASAADAKYWELISNSSGTMILRAMNDAYAVASIALSIVRTGAALTSITYGNATDNPTHIIDGLLTVNAGVAGVHTINSLNGASDTLTLNAPSGQFTTLNFSNAGATKGIIYWDNSASLLRIKTAIDAMQITTAGIIRAAASPLGSANTQVLTGVCAELAAPQAITSNAALTLSPGLTVTVNEVGVYALECLMFVNETTSSAGGFQFNLGGTAVVTAAISPVAVTGFSNANIGAVAGISSTVQSFATIQIAAAVSWFRWHGTITVTTAGTLGPKVAQVVSSANATNILIGSHFKLVKIA